ncbi:RHS repeat protein [Cytophaga aurantiaca]|uniref:RHS repeat protein n=1 Tax=Cytophaga aurantiaca TaxID=29530 RepID=UPI00036CD263|nr:RHS repeat protein [Cytophaga aurantiaca]
MSNRFILKLFFCLISFLSIHLVHAGKKENTLKLINTITELPILKWGDESEFIHGFYIPIREYSEVGNISVVELRTPQREIMYRCEVTSNEDAMPVEILVYTSVKTSNYTGVDNGTYEVKPCMRIKISYEVTGKMKTISYKNIVWGEDATAEEIALDYLPNGMIWRVYHTKSSDYGPVFEAYYANGHADSITIGVLGIAGKVVPFAIRRSVYDAKWNVIRHTLRYVDDTYFETDLILYAADGKVQEWYKRKYATEGSTKEVSGYVFTYENSKVIKANYYFDYVSDQTGKLEDVKNLGRLKKEFYYTYSANGNLLSYKDALITDCVIADRTTTYTLDAKGMVLKQTTVDKTKYKCKY